MLPSQIYRLEASSTGVEVFPASRDTEDLPHERLSISSSSKIQLPANNSSVLDIPNAPYSSQVLLISDTLVKSCLSHSLSLLVSIFISHLIYHQRSPNGIY